MLFTRQDPRSAWSRLGHLPEPSPAQVAELLALPAGAREVPLTWVCDFHRERRVRFDRDAQEEVVSEQVALAGWLAAPDPRIRHAGAISFHGVESLPPGFLQALPPSELLGPGIRALALAARHLVPGDLRALGERRAWEDLAVWGPGWSAPVAATWARELADHHAGLLGLELHGAPLSDADLLALAGSGFAPGLLDLTLTGSRLPAAGAMALFDALGALDHLDLRDAGLGAEPIGRLAPKLRRARRLQLSGCPFGDEGLEALLAAGALDAVEDLWLGGCALTDRAARALVEARPPRLRGLWIHGNRLTDQGLEQLVRSPLFAGLEGASLHQPGLTARSASALAGHPLEGALRATTRLPGVSALWFQGRPSPLDPWSGS